MSIDGLSQEDTAEIVRTMRAVRPVEKAVLFGSRAKGTFKRGSDVDLALWGIGLDHRALLDLSVRLNEESCMPYRFDLIDHATINNSDLKAHIDRVGKVVYERETQ